MMAVVSISPAQPIDRVPDAGSVNVDAPVIENMISSASAGISILIAVPTTT